MVRLRVPGGTTMIAKQPRRREMFVRELEALRLLPATVRPALLASGSDLFVVEGLGSVPPSPTCSLVTSRTPPSRR